MTWPRESRSNAAITTVIEHVWPGLHVLVVGDVMLDKYISGDVERISPEAPVPIVRALRHAEQPGGAGNVAMNLAALGSQVTLFGVVGDDADGRSLCAGLEAAGMVCALSLAEDQPTTSKTRILGGRQQMLRLDVEQQQPLAAEVGSELLSRVLARLTDRPRVSAVILSDYAKGLLTSELCQAVIQEAGRQGVPVVVDPKGKDFSRYRGAAVLCPNISELALAVGIPPQEAEAVLEAGETMIGAWQVAAIAVTRSERGITLLDGQTRIHAPAVVRQVFDVSGAGDTVTAILALCRASGIDPEQAIRLANLAAGLVVAKTGTAPVGRGELLQAVHERQAAKAEVAESNRSALGHARPVSGCQKILSMEAMRGRVERWRMAGERIVFTNGCFDLLHAGHVALIQEARKVGDRLIVGLNSDASVEALKGPLRPVTGQGDRATMLAALEGVDGVVIFDEETPLRTILALRPDVLVKGSDYVADEIVGASEVKAWGGTVLLVPMAGGWTTTRLIAKVLTPSARLPLPRSAGQSS